MKLRLAGHLISSLLVAASLSHAETTLPAPITTHLPLTSVLTRGDQVLTANAAGLFQARLSDKTWHPISTPPLMPPGGMFVSNQKVSAEIYYVASRSVIYEAPEAKDKTFGLYRSSDDGKNWSLVSKNDFYSWAYLHLDGSLYALTRGASGRRGGDTVEVTHDRGKSWKPIYTGESMVCDIFADPDHRDQVCLTTNFIRNYVLQASDRTYRWQSTREWEWWPDHETEERFFAVPYSASTTLYMLSATLENYFTYPFRERCSLPGFALAPEKAAYEFARDDPKKIRVSVRFLTNPNLATLRSPTGTERPWTPDLKTKLVDHTDQARCWGLRIVTPDIDRKIVVPADRERFVFQRERSRIITQKPKDGSFETHTIETDLPYERELDLGAFYDFRQPGSYKVELTYEYFSEVRGADEPWGGSFSSGVFGVTIR